jgi:putative oxidoreductase
LDPEIPLEVVVLPRLFATRDDLLPLIIRCTVGLVILPHGLQKLLGWFGGHGPAATIEAFQQWFGLPMTVTALVIAAESFGALSLILGFATRLCAASIGLVMIGAITMVTGRWGFFMNWYNEQGRGEGFEYHLLVLGMVAVLILDGGGRYSVDRWVSGRLKNEPG